MLVVDASVIAMALGTGGSQAAASLDLIGRKRLAAPDLMRIEVVSVWRRQSSSGRLGDAEAALALSGLLELQVDVFASTLLLDRSWELRNNYSTYDACYVALAEALGCPLATADTRLAHAPGARCEFILVEPTGT